MLSEDCVRNLVVIIQLNVLINCFILFFNADNPRQVVLQQTGGTAKVTGFEGGCAPGVKRLRSREQVGTPLGNLYLNRQVCCEMLQNRDQANWQTYNTLEPNIQFIVKSKNSHTLLVKFFGWLSHPTSYIYRSVMIVGDFQILSCIGRGGLNPLNWLLPTFLLQLGLVFNAQTVATNDSLYSQLYRCCPLHKFKSCGNIPCCLHSLVMY